MRPSFFSYLALIGGFIGMITRMANFSLKSYATFTLDKSMIKRLYSSKQTKKGKNETFYNKTSDSYNLSPEQNSVKDTI